MASGQQAAAPTTDNQTNNVSIRVIALAHATNENEDVHLVLSLDTTISELKTRLQQNLSKHPAPATQRLIYQGRALTNGDARLRHILRLDPNNASSPPAHVLHLVVRDHQPSNPPVTARPQSAPIQSPPPTEDNRNRSGAALTNPTLGLAQQALQGHPAHGLLQNVLQQHMAIHNQHLQQQMPHGHHIPPPPISSLPQFAAMQSGHPQIPRANPELPTSHSPPSTTGATNNSNSPDVFQSRMTMRVQETIGPNGERIRRVVQQGGPSLPFSTNPVERSASSPGAAPRSMSPNTHDRDGASPLPSLHPRGPIVISDFPHIFPPPHLGISPTIPSFTSPSVPSQPPRNPTVFLVSSPTGPEALLLAPNHGFFSTIQIPPFASQSSPQTNGTLDHPQQPAPPSTTGPAHQTRGNTRNNDQAQLALRPQGQAQAPLQAQAQPARREGEDLVALILQRGWLFLRLYMFIFVLSEPGTWRRYMMLTIASLVCLLPRNNPFTELFQVARRHFDNIIGPPQPPLRQENQAQGQQAAGNQVNGNNLPNNVADNTTRANANSMPTPEQHARRLLQQHEQRNPSMVRDILYRVEQAVLLFLASLIPGVGERHVRAREEARRIVQEEQERQRQQNDERTQQTQHSDSNDKSEVRDIDQSTGVSSEIGNTAAAATGTDTASSNSVSASTANEGLRQRTVDTQ